MNILIKNSEKLFMTI